MDVTLTLSPQETAALSHRADGTTIITIPQTVLIQAYCDYVAAQAKRPTPRNEGVLVQ
jgi:hypothetical protein